MMSKKQKDSRDLSDVKARLGLNDFEGAREKLGLNDEPPASNTWRWYKWVPGAWRAECKEYPALLLGANDDGWWAVWDHTGSLADGPDAWTVEGTVATKNLKSAKQAAVVAAVKRIRDQGYKPTPPKDDAEYDVSPSLPRGKYDYQLRVIEEYRELHERLEKLSAFTDTPYFHELPDVERALLDQQGLTMAAYGLVLSKRIMLFLEGHIQRHKEWCG